MLLIFHVHDVLLLLLDLFGEVRQERRQKCVKVTSQTVPFLVDVDFELGDAVEGIGWK